MFRFRLYILYILLPLSLFSSCRNKHSDASQTQNGAFAKAKKTMGADLERIETSGEFIVGTISGPDTYFDYQGRGMGLQYALAEDFASKQGVAVRVELCTDTLDLVKKLDKGEIDAIVLQIPSAFFANKAIVPAGAKNEKQHTSWAVAAASTDLAEALNDWYNAGIEVATQKKEVQQMKERTVVHRKVRAPYISKEKGIISTYDNYFKEAARRTGWDWKLIAAQCYQESGFDPNATSGAGASGLMQIMPKTAEQFGLPLSDIFNPTANIATASRILVHLQKQFSDISNAEERAKFVLAAYNAGYGHISDARALARKYKQDANKWSTVGQYVLNLSRPQYYRDPVATHGYMIGSETFYYVQKVMERWQAYGGNVHSLTVPSGANLSSTASNVRTGDTRITPHKRNRYSKEQHILSPEEMQ